MLTCRPSFLIESIILKKDIGEVIGSGAVPQPIVNITQLVGGHNGFTV